MLGMLAEALWEHEKFVYLGQVKGRERGEVVYLGHAKRNRRNKSVETDEISLYEELLYQIVHLTCLFRNLEKIVFH